MWRYDINANASHVSKNLYEKKRLFYWQILLDLQDRIKEMN